MEGKGNSFMKENKFRASLRYPSQQENMSSHQDREIFESSENDPLTENPKQHEQNRLLPESLLRLSSGVSIASLDGVIGCGLFEDKSITKLERSIEDILNETSRDEHVFNESLSLLQTLEDAFSPSQEKQNIQQSTNSTHSDNLVRERDSLKHSLDIPEKLSISSSVNPPIHHKHCENHDNSLCDTIGGLGEEEIEPQRLEQAQERMTMDTPTYESLALDLTSDSIANQKRKAKSLSMVGSNKKARMLSSSLAEKQETGGPFTQTIPLDEECNIIDIPLKTSTRAQASQSQKGIPTKGQPKANKSKKLPEARRIRKVEGDKLRRRRRKEEYQELRDSIARMNSEREQFLKTIEELTEQARSLEYGSAAGGTVEDNRLRVQNNLLKEELQEERNFVNRLKVVMEETLTTSTHLKNHNARLHKMQLRRKCIECCENSLSECIGLAVVSAPSTPNTVWQDAKMGTSDGLPVRYELLPEGSNFESAKRLNIRIEIELPLNFESLSQAIRSWRSTANAVMQQQAKRIQESTTKTTARLLYSDDDYETKPVENDDPVVKGLHVTEMLSGSKAQSVIAMMVKKLEIPKACLNTLDEANPMQFVGGIVHVSSNAKEVFADEGAHTLTSKAEKQLLMNTHFYTPSVKKSDGKTIKEYTKLVIVDSSPLGHLMKEGLELKDSVFTGKIAEKNCELIKLLCDLCSVESS